MYYVNKIVTWCLSPLGVLFLGLAAGWLCRRCASRRWRLAGTVVVALALAQIWVLGCGVATRFIGVPLEGEERDVSDADLAGARAIVLLGGGMGVHAKCHRPEICASADRAWTAARTWKRFKSDPPVVTVSGGGARGEIALLQDMGVDTNNVVVLENPRNTEEEARKIRAVLDARDAASPREGATEKRRDAASPTTNHEPRATNHEALHPKILLVTSAWHMPRACMLFERAGFDVTPVPADFEMNYVAESDLRGGDFFPSVDALSRNSYAVKEWVARFCYWLKR